MVKPWALPFLYVPCRLPLANIQDLCDMIDQLDSAFFLYFYILGDRAESYVAVCMLF